MDAVPEDLFRQRDFLRRMARALTGDAATAEDVVQEVELRALTHAPASGPLGAWLTTVTRRLAANVRRARARREEHERGAARVERIEGPLETLAGLELQARVLAAVRALEEPYRTTLWLRFYEDLPPRAIARRVEVPLATVKTRLARGLALLRTRLDAEHGGRRESWALALAPLAHTSAPVLVPLTLGGLWTMKKLALVAVVLVVAWVGYRETRRAPESSVAASSDSAPALTPTPAPILDDVEAVSAPAARSEAAAPDPNPASARESAATVVVSAHWAPEGEAAAELGLVLMPATGDARELRAREARTDATGLARLEGLASGAWILHDERGGELELELAPGEERHVELVLPAMISVTGRVVDEDGHGIPRAEVWLERLWGTGRGSPLLDGRVVAHADEQGEFRLRGLRAESAVGAFARGYSPAPLALVRMLAPVPGASVLEIELVLESGARRLAGRVLDADGAPCAGALLVLGTKGNEVRGEHWKARGRLFESDSEGRFAADWIAPEWGIEAAQLQLTVLAEEHALLFVPSSEVFAALDGELVVRLQRGARVAGRVRSASGRGVEGAEVAVLASAGRDAASVPFPLPRVRADGQGNFLLPHVTSGPAQIIASSVDRAERAGHEGELIDGAEYVWDLELGELAAIRGRVVDEQGLPLAERSVLVGNGELVTGVVSGADGAFFYEPEDPESEWTFSLIGSAGYDDQRAGVKLGQEIVLVAHTHSGVVVGSFLDEAGAVKPGKALQVALLTVGDVILSIGAELDGAGAFRFEQVAAGEYQVEITCGGTSIASSDTFTLEAGGFRDLGELVSR